MADEPFVQRVVTVDDREVSCRFFKPEGSDRYFTCRWEIEWAEGVQSKTAAGVDEIQALLLSMQMAHAHLLVAREHDGRRITFEGQRSLGLPLAQTMRDWDPEGEV